jgi:hypothetical protein
MSAIGVPRAKLAERPVALRCPAEIAYGEDEDGAPNSCDR